MVVIDSTILLLLFRPETKVPAGPDGLPIPRAKERIDLLVEQLTKARTKIVIPTPVLSEILVRAGAAASEEIVAKLQKYSVFQVESFDTRAAIEMAAMARDGGSPRKRVPATAIYAKLKFDRQIVAIAKVVGATTIYSDDGDIATIAKRANITVIGLGQLPLPPAEEPDLFTAVSYGSAEKSVEGDDEKETQADA